MLLQIENVTHYFGGLCAVSEFNLNLDQGELIGIIGPNGAGKTTIFNLITGVYKATHGNIKFQDIELVGKRPNAITNLGIARTFQNIRLFQELSALDNVRIANYGQIKYSPLHAFFHIGRFSKEEQRTINEAMELLDDLNLADFADETSRNLPYGLQRRLEIARALATHPKLLLLDEPAAGINPGEISQLLEFIRWVRDQFSLTIILIEHQMRLVMNVCERITVLDFGKTIAEGTPEEIQNNPQVLEAYLGEEGGLG
jgi:branched-chain amino acid transport system ATP-binding protein